MNHLRQFRQAVHDFKKADQSLQHDIMDISEETELMIEVDDILDELSILKLVLVDQKRVAHELDDTLKAAAGDSTGRSYIKTKTLDDHLARIEQMEAAAKKADKSVSLSM